MADLKRACDLAPDNADAGGVRMALAEFGDPVDATAALKRAAQLRLNEGFENPCTSASSWTTAAAAATCTRQGLAIIEHQSSLGDPDADERVCGACCALVEQLLVAAADDVEDVADSGAPLRRCCRGGCASAEPMQAMASLRSMQGRTRRRRWRRCAGRWRPRPRRGGREVDPDADENDDAADEFEGVQRVVRVPVRDGQAAAGAGREHGGGG